jgi:LysR family transcriptional regulator, glycine cleavage system transcriptional activator
MSRPIRTRPVTIGNWRAFEAVARHQSFSHAALELSLTQPAISRQIQSLEEEIGTTVFIRNTRTVELTGAGSRLYRQIPTLIQKLDATVKQIRREATSRSVEITTWSSFASLWLIARLEEFQSEYPGVNIRIDTSDALANLSTTYVDMAIRYSADTTIGDQGGLRLFGEQLTAVASPRLISEIESIKRPEDLLRATLIDLNFSTRSDRADSLGWPAWFKGQNLADLEPTCSIYYTTSQQVVQAALAGQGIALARTPFVADKLASGELVEVLPGSRLDSPFAYWLVTVKGAGGRPEVKAFGDWLKLNAKLTRQLIGEGDVSADVPPRSSRTNSKRVLPSAV